MRILIVNPFGIGDVLFSTPLISNIKAAVPESYIGYICNIRAQDALSGNPQIDQIFVFEKDEYRNLWKQAKLKAIKKFISFLLQIKKKKFDVVFDLSLGRKYSLFLWLIGIRMRVGYNYKNRGRFLTHKINIDGYETMSIPDYYLKLLEFFHIRPKRYNLTMTLASEDKDWVEQFFRKNHLSKQGLVIGLIPAGGASWGKDFSYRHWPEQNYAQLASKLITQLGAKIIILGAVSEANICQRIQASINGETLNACGQTNLKQFAALLGKCNLVVCSDGGPLHVAVSQRVKTISIFGPVDEKVYGPYPSGANHVVVTHNIECRPCYKRFKLPVCPYNRRCIREISVAQVFKIIKDNLREEK